VVRYRVYDDAKTQLARATSELPKSFLAAQFRIQYAMVRHVIAMRAAGPGLRQRRGIAVGYAKLTEVTEYFARPRQSKVAIELKTVRTRWNTRVHDRESNRESNLGNIVYCS
jgi:hypothetical protein